MKITVLHLVILLFSAEIDILEMHYQIILTTKKHQDLLFDIINALLHEIAREVYPQLYEYLLY